jgi:Cof subfamily protein (haloacid dehalogenase superfamily)
LRTDSQELDGFCGINNGTAVMDMRTQDLRYRNRFHPDAVEGLIRIALTSGAKFCVTGTYQTHQLKEWQVEPYYDPAQTFTDDDVWPCVLYDTVEEFAKQCRADAQRLFLQLPYSDEQVRKQIYGLINKITPADITTSGDDGIEIVPQGASKVDAMKVLADIYNVRMENIMAFGDQINDLSMLQAAGVGVAMENGDPKLKKQANRVAPPNIEGGVAKVIWQMVL